MARSSSRNALAYPPYTIRVITSGFAWVSDPVDTRVEVGETGYTASQSHESWVTTPTNEGGIETRV